eukprot:GCRY01002421.1.p1 GENE.GCRY01002421.1~~GCRY01002421.1.p1  ORF type:complete len:267 (-),score=66.66 GCRY01002421.1:9-809(-)
MGCGASKNKKGNQGAAPEKQSKNEEYSEPVEKKSTVLAENAAPAKTENEASEGEASPSEGGKEESHDQESLTHSETEEEKLSSNDDLIAPNDEAEMRKEVSSEDSDVEEVPSPAAVQEEKGLDQREETDCTQSSELSQRIEALCETLDDNIDLLNGVIEDDSDDEKDGENEEFATHSNELLVLLKALHAAFIHQLNFFLGWRKEPSVPADDLQDKVEDLKEVNKTVQDIVEQNLSLTENSHLKSYLVVFDTSLAAFEELWATLTAD